MPRDTTPETPEFRDAHLRYMRSRRSTASPAEREAALAAWRRAQADRLNAEIAKLYDAAESS